MLAIILGTTTSRPSTRTPATVTAGQDPVRHQRRQPSPTHQQIARKLPLVVVGEEGPGDRLPGVVVVPDGSGQGEDALQHAHDDACRGVPAVAFQVELALEGVVDRLDDLPQRPEQVRAGSPVRAGRSSRTPWAASAASNTPPK